ncbi:MAG TPA: molybdopterin molybdotransferase MoeA [Opitutaceae bacterium]|nr:molybdopterin molybdotransferase MoeA [Opitutaceae bacterium]
MLSVSEAERVVLESVPPLPVEDCPIAGAHGRILREAVRADRDLPPFDRATLDGIAIRHGAFAGGVRSFKSEGVQAAGMIRKARANPDACLEIMTGAVLPDGCDTVVPVEDLIASENRFDIREGATINAGQGVHGMGSDARKGDVLIEAGTRLGSPAIAIAASVGMATLRTSQLPRVAVVATGDELVEVEARVADHQIRRSNDHAIRAALIAFGCPKVDRFHLRDVANEVEKELRALLVRYDWIVVTGGVSKGKRDFLPAALETLGVRKRVHGVAQRPGKPFWFGVTPRGTPVFALPGNPVSSLTCLHRYVLPAVERAAGLKASRPRSVALAKPVTFHPPLAWLLPVRLSSAPDGRLLAEPDPSNTSGDFAGLVDTDGFVELPADQAEFPAGTVAPFRAWV